MSRAMRELQQRVARIERAFGNGPLSKAEVAELAALEAERAKIFPVDIDDMDGELLDEAIRWLVGDQAARLAHLRHRALPLSEQAELRATEIALAAMTFDEIGEWIDEKARAARALEEEQSS